MEKKVNKFSKVSMSSDKKSTHAEVLEVENIKIAELCYNPQQPRKIKDKKFIAELADDIARNGLLQPIIYTEKEGKLYIVAGHTRLEAYKLLKRKTIEAICKDNMTDKNFFLFSLAENETRKQLLNVEIGLSYKKALDIKLFKNQRELAKNINSTERIVGAYLSLVKLDSEIIDIILKENLKLDTDALLMLKKFDNPVEIFKELKEKNFSRKVVAEHLEKLKSKEAVGDDTDTPQEPIDDLVEHDEVLGQEKLESDDNYEEIPKSNSDDHEKTPQNKKYIYKSDNLNALDMEYLSNRLKDKFDIPIDTNTSKMKDYVLIIKEI